MVTINKNSNQPYYEQLVFGIKEEILQGILRAGDQVPSVREMAKRLLMNPNTVSKAYKILEAEHILITVQGRGTFVKSFDNTKRDENRIKKWQQQLNILLIEAQHLQITEEELQDWIVETMHELGGNKQ